jgi:hypothetical protein
MKTKMRTENRRGNRGMRNVGNYNDGDNNTGVHNTGSFNVGCFNCGDGNSGNYNIGTENSGDYNRGSMNSGMYNTGNVNSGNYNLGNRNSGDWNRGDDSTGCFNTIRQKIFLFNRPSDWTMEDWRSSRACELMNEIVWDPLVWTDSRDMTLEEKRRYPGHEVTGGFLRNVDRSGRAMEWWQSLAQEDKKEILSIPNFDRAIFREITGIDVTEEEMERILGNKKSG